jgi:anthranilate phosphoribosyltransferase
MAGFLDATQARLHLVPDNGLTTVVLPSYNGARKLPVLTPLLALLLAQQGAAVVLHGTATETARVSSASVLAALGVQAMAHVGPVAAGHVALIPTEVLCPGLKRLLDVRRVVGLRNPAHSLVKLMNPCAGRALVVGSYTHPEYAISMGATFALTGQQALLLRGTEGEPVADPRRTPQMALYQAGTHRTVQTAQTGSLAQVPELPGTEATTTARYIQAVLQGEYPVPTPIALQVQHILQALSP